MDSINKVFNPSAQTCLPDTAFLNYLCWQFNSDVARDIYLLFKDLGLALPEENEEFLRGLEGALVFLEDRNLVLRIEWTEASGELGFDAERVNDNPFILQPIVSITAGLTVLEICPGVHQAQSLEEKRILVQTLELSGVDFWDAKLSNIGRLPFKAPKFPNGIPVVIDRLALRQLTNSASDVKKELNPLKNLISTTKEKALGKNNEVACQAQEFLYTPLREAFRVAWPDRYVSPDPEKMKAFWDLCEQHACEGKLIAGWQEEQSEDMRNEDPTWGQNRKTVLAKEVAAKYKTKAYSI